MFDRLRNNNESTASGGATAAIVVKKGSKKNVQQIEEKKQDLNRKKIIEAPTHVVPAGSYFTPTEELCKSFKL